MPVKEELSKIVGKKRVIEDANILESYASDQSFVSPGMPWCVVKPENAEEVQGVVKWANENTVPLIPVSSPDGPRFRGDTIPSQGGVIVDLSGMKKILNIDRRDKVAIVEPGVTFDQLESELRKNDLRALKPLLPRKTKSVLSSYLEREPIVVPREHWDFMDPLICTEIVFGTGDIFRTGSAAMSGTLQEQLEAGMRHVMPLGPSATDFARVVQGAQGTIGIVTWASIVCGVIPTIQKGLFIASEDLEPLIDLTCKLTRDRIGEEFFLLNGFAFATIMGKGFYEIRKLCADLPPWILFLNITANRYFPEEKIQYQEEQVQELVQALGLQIRTSVGGFSGQAMQRLLDSAPDEYYKMKYKGGCQEIFFVTTMDKTPAFIEQMSGECEAQQFSTMEMGIYIQPTIQGGSCHCEFILPYNSADVKEKARMQRFLPAASARLAHAGAFFSRPYGPWADIAYCMDAETTGALRKVKGIFDPKGILNPGKLCF